MNKRLFPRGPRRRCGFELADARRMSESNIYDFFAKVATNATSKS